MKMMIKTFTKSDGYESQKQYCHCRFVGRRRTKLVNEYVHTEKKEANTKYNYDENDSGLMKRK